MKLNLTFGPNDRYRITLAAPANPLAEVMYCSMLVTAEGDDDDEVWMTRANVGQLIDALLAVLREL